MSDYSKKSVTYWPLTGGFYAGDQTKVDMKTAQSYLKPIATLKAKEVTPDYDGKTSLIANSELVTQSPALTQAATNYALTGAADPTNLSNLQQIQLIRRVIGDPEYYFALDQAFETINVPMLQAREPIQGTFAVGDYQDPLEETEFSEAKFDEISYNLKKIPIKIYTPIEDIMRTVINPQDINLRTAAQALAQRRNRYAADALATISTNSNVGQIDAIASGAFHSTNETAREISDICNTHLEDNSSKLSHIVMNTSDFAKYTSNTWTNAGPTNMQINRIVGAGVAPFPGVSGLTAVIDPMVPANTAYLIDRLNGTRLAEGPKIERRFYDEERDAEAIKLLDFNEYKIVTTSNVNRIFSRKITFATS